MNYEHSHEQELLRSTARDLLTAHASMKAVRQAMDAGATVAPELWGRMAELGWMGLALPERFGGSGLGPTELAIVCEELGRCLAPVPFLPSQIAARAIWEAGSDEQRTRWLPDFAAGRTIGTFALDAAQRPDAPVGLRARRAGSEWSLGGSAGFVPDADAADWLIVSAPTSEPESAPALFAVARDTRGLSVERVKSIDLLRPLYRVGFDDVALADSMCLHGRGDRVGALRRTLDLATIGVCAEMLGGAERCLEASVAHACQREQFGQPIGSYQAIQHKCADMLFEVECARSITYYAAWAAGDGRQDAELYAAMAKAYLSDAYGHVSGENIQIHGGVGFTWEYDCHLYFKRAKSDGVWLGDAVFHRERVAQLLAIGSSDVR